ncbi:hypothetical protein CCHR01_09973 [Colletotrichum chrysophilum]|uniref:Uncharacterized protein n=1 Tax=Colletotrichum chrysophilum TaxID=1836956 RepID=A0AAD9AI67_9PEZI|nr:hypothetical protein CCHR01_09973 [Colletotrichum chrysophilum]
MTVGRPFPWVNQTLGVYRYFDEYNTARVCHGPFSSI